MVRLLNHLRTICITQTVSPINFYRKKNTDKAFEGLLDGVICPFGSSFISFKRFENDFKSFQVSLVDH